MALETSTKYMVRIKTYNYRLLESFDTVEDAQAKIDTLDTPADYFIQPEIVYVEVAP